MGSGIPAVDQSNLCAVDTYQYETIVNQCKVGQKIAFLPNSFGNEQLPILFAAANCDLRYNLALTNGGVICIYGPITPATARASD